MGLSRCVHRLAVGVAASAMAAAIAAGPAAAQGKEPIKIGVIFDYTGPFAAGGSEAAALGTKYMIEMVNAKGGVEGHKIEPIFVDAQSKPDVAINEAVRLLNQETVDLLLGV